MTLCGFLAALGLQVVMAQPAAAIPGLQNVTATSAVSSNVFHGATANCPAGKVVIGGGGRLLITTGEVSITHLGPTTTNGYQIGAYEDFDGYAGAWGVEVTAICAFPPAGYEIQTASTPMASPATATITANCTAGKRLLGTGGAVAPGRSIVLLHAIAPGPTLANPTAVTTMGAEIQGGTLNTWNVTAWAICANPILTGMVVTVSATNSVSPKTQTSTCPGGRFVHGVGFAFGGVGVGELFLNAAHPTPAMPFGTAVPVTASEDQNGVGGNWNIQTYAICLA